jgi:hypothetical protein
MIRSGAAEQPEPARQPFRIIHPLLSAFRTAAQRLALSAGAWRLRLRQWWKDLAAELTLDLRPRKTKQIRKSKAKGNSARHPAPSRLI